MIMPTSLTTKIGYRSTNGSPEIVDFGTVVLRGLAPDKGLYTPISIPKLPAGFTDLMKYMTLPDIATEVVGHFTDIPYSELEKIMFASYNFNLPMTQAGERYIQYQGKGPTLSFKDLGMRPFARFMQYYLAKRGATATILAATSGDTGSAGADAFYGLDNITYAVLFPEDEITPRQRKLMTTLAERKAGRNNVIPIAFRGKFDYGQKMEKDALVDPELRHMNLSSANSINFGRLVSQSVQFHYAYSLAAEPGEKIVFSVPCGNFGHLTGGLIAQLMGLPVHKFVAAVNENDEFPKLMETGIYAPIKPSKKCISNSMNVGHASNLPRIVSSYGGRMDEEGKMLFTPDMAAMARDIYSTSVSDSDTRLAMRRAFMDHGIVLEPHGAVAWEGLDRFLEESGWKGKSVVFETMDPWKSPDEVRNAIGREPFMPQSMAGLEDAKEFYIRIRNFGELKEILLQLY